MILCNHCKRSKSQAEFSGNDRVCIVCRNRKRRLDYCRDDQLFRLYGLFPGQFEVKLKDQDGAVRAAIKN